MLVSFFNCLDAGDQKDLSGHQHRNLVANLICLQDLSLTSIKTFSKTDFHWFNPYPPVFGPEEEKEYMLIGMILGLAIYNNITLDVNFPPVLFKKILGYPGTFDDMEEAHPTIYRSMVTLLQYDGELPVEDCFCLTYQGNSQFPDTHFRLKNNK